VYVTTRGADGLVPVRDREGVFDFSVRFRIAGVGTGKEAVALGGERINGDGPAAGGCEFVREGAKAGAGGGARDSERSLAGVAVDTLSHEDAARGVEEKRVGAEAPLEVAGSHGAEL
jgi:hypothetical protein